MSFLTPILLAGAAAFLIPLLIHLLNRRRVLHVRWGAMHLLHEVLRQRRRRMQIEQWLLLAVRIAIPVVLALCLARPVLDKLGSLIGLGKSSLVTLLDDSFSTRAPASAGNTVSDQAHEIIQRMDQALPRGSDAQVVLAGGTPHPLFDAATTQLDLIPPALADTPSAAGPVQINDAIQTAGAALQKSNNAARELAIISDFQSSDWKTVADGASLPALEALSALEHPPQVTFYRIAGDLAENLSIVSAELSAMVVAVDQPVGLRVRVQNHGKRPWQDVALHLEADSGRIRTARISVPANGEASLSFTHAFDTTGDHALSVRLEGDSFPDDNAFHAIVQVRDQIRVLLIDGDPHTEPLTGPLDFFELALMPNQNAAATLRDLIHTTKVDARRFRGDDLRGKQVVVLGNVDRPSGTQLKELETFVKAGGGLMIFPGPKADPTTYDREFYKNGQGLFPCPVKGQTHVDSIDLPARLQLQRFTHPALTYFNDPRAGRLGDAEINHWWILAPEGNQSSTFLSLDRGLPVLVERAFERGLVIACATSADPTWNNLALQPWFVPLMQRMMIHLATRSTTSAWHLVGKSTRISLPSDQAGKAFTLTDPLGKQTELKSQGEKDDAFIEIPTTNTPGIFQVIPGAPPADGSPTPQADPTTVRRLAFNVDSAESDLTLLPAADVEKIATRFGAGFAEDFDSYTKLDRTRRVGSEVWQPFLLALLALLFFEVLLQQRIARG